DRAIKLLRQAAPVASGRQPRRVILVIGDGANESAAWDDADNQKRFNLLARTAAGEGIVIDAMAYSVHDRRDPYPNLAHPLRAPPAPPARPAPPPPPPPPLAAPPRARPPHQPLPFFPPPELVVDAKLRLVCKSGACGETPLASNARKGPMPACGAAACKLS